MFLEKKAQPKLPKFDSKFKSEAGVTSLTLKERHTATTTCNTWIETNRKSVYRIVRISFPAWVQAHSQGGVRGSPGTGLISRVHI